MMNNFRHGHHCSTAGRTVKFLLRSHAGLPDLSLTVFYQRRALEMSMNPAEDLPLSSLQFQSGAIAPSSQRIRDAPSCKSPWELVPTMQLDQVIVLIPQLLTAHTLLPHE